MSGETRLREEMADMEAFYKKKLTESRTQISDLTSKLKRAEEELSSFKDRMAEDLSVSLDAALDTENLTCPVNVTRLQEMYHHLRVNKWPKAKRQIQSDRAQNIIQGIFKAAVTRVDSVKEALSKMFPENMAQEELPKKVQDHLRCCLDNLQLALFHCNKQDLYCAAVMDAPEVCRELLSELFWLFCLMALSKTPLQPQWDSSRTANPWDCLPDKLTQLTRKDRKKTSDDQHLQSPLRPVFTHLEEDIVTFVREQLMRFHRLLTSKGRSEHQEKTPTAVDQRSTDAFLKITLNFLKRMDQEQLAERLMKLSTSMKQREENNVIQHSTMKYEEQQRTVQRQLKSHLQQKFSQVCEGVATAGDPASLLQIYSELSITEQSSDTPLVCEDIFKRPESGGSVRTVLTVGPTGIGKTLLTQKFSLDWAEGRTNQDVQLLFPFTFRDLNELKDKSFSLMTLLHHCFSQTKGICSFDGLQLLFIFDGLDECRLPLDFSQTQVLTEYTESASVEELLVNLIRGSLLPFAQLWITTRPTAANHVPAECISMVTELQGFTNIQKEQFFRKRFKDEPTASAVISHIKNNPSLRIMSHSPVFCWTLSDFIHKKKVLPNNLTNLYIHFLQDNFLQKYRPDNSSKIQETVGRLAFKELKEGNLTFSKSDLSKRGLDDSQVNCFTHPNVKALLAALYVHQTFLRSRENLLSSHYGTQCFKTDFYHSAVDRAIQNPNLDLFLPFVLGLSMSTNQKLLKILVSETENYWINQELVKYIHMKMNEVSVSAEGTLSLLQCLNELNDHSLLKEMQKIMTEGRLDDRQMSPAQWSTVSFLLLSSHSDLEEFNLKRFCPSAEGLQKLLPVVKASRKANLSSCNLNSSSCTALAPVLSSSSLTSLDLSNNDLEDSGVEQLCFGLKSATCRLHTLRLSGCMISENGGASLASALCSASSNLRELDLSYNHLGRSAKLLAALQAPRGPLRTLRLEPAGEQFLTPGLKKYFCELSLNPNTANKRLELSGNNGTVTQRSLVQYPDIPQVLCSPPLTGRCYWEVDFSLTDSGSVYLGVTYSGKGASEFGNSLHSWALRVSRENYMMCHDGKNKLLPHKPPHLRSHSHTMAVYLDSEAGSLSFYDCSSGILRLIGSFQTTFTERMCAGFRLQKGKLSLVGQKQSSQRSLYF